MTDALYTIQESTLTDIADAIRTKKGTSSPIAVTDFADEIESISGGGGGTYTKKGIQSFTIAPTDPQYVSDAYKGSWAQDKTLSNYPSYTDFLDTFYDCYTEETLEGYSVTKRVLGKDQSNTYDIYEYDFCPEKWDRMILLTSGMHTYEVGGQLGLAYFMQSLMERHEGDALLDYMYEHVRIKCIPIINPWGFNQSPKKYGNVNGVNINRNFDYNGMWEEFPTYSPNPSDPNYNEWNVKGDYPFSEAETLILKDWLENNLGAEFWIDCHTGLGYSDIDLWTYSLSTSPYYSKMLSAEQKLIAWTKDYYNVNTVNANFVFDDATSMKEKWSEGKYGVPMLVIEQAPKCDTWGGSKNGDAAGAVNYTAQIYAYVGEFLLKNDETVVSNTYIESLQQTAINNKKYQTASVFDRLSSIEASKTKKTYVVNETLSVADVVVVAIKENGQTETVTNKAVIDTSEVDMSTVGTYDISVSYSERGITKTATIEIAVSSSGRSITIKQGGISNTDGSLIESASRVYTEDAIPVTQFPCSVSVDSSLFAAGRMYKANDTFDKAVEVTSGAYKYYFTDGNIVQGWVNGDLTLRKGDSISQPAAYIRLVFRNTSDTAVTPSDVSGLTVTVDGITYTFVAGT